MEGEIDSADHQLLIDASSNSEEHPVIFDRIEMETPAATPSPLPMNYTTVATSVPAGETVDDASDSLSYSESGWERKEHPFFYGNTSSVTTTPGSWVQLTFVGTGIWQITFNSAIRKYGRETTREITTHNFTLPDLELPIYQAPLLAHPELTYANAYIYNITLISGIMQLDFIRIAGNLAPFDSDDVQTIDQATSSQNGPDLKTIVIPSVAGAAFVLLAVGLATFLCKRHRKGRPPTFESDVCMVQGGEGGFVEPFYPVSIQSLIATSGSRTGKAGLHSIFLDQPGPLSPPTGYLPSSVGTESVALDDGNSNNQDYSRQDLSQMGQENEYEVEEGGLSLSHAELAKVFRRAEQLRLHNLHEGDRSGGSEELDPPLEALARQLAIRGVSTE
ncbi:hypothetical protein FRC19_000581 [Serendipita sp. 401]|nr:hypothetical protein FRC19_000581 [Serendipita sp. 401]